MDGTKHHSMLFWTDLRTAKDVTCKRSRGLGNFRSRLETMHVLCKAHLYKEQRTNK
jgi:hypothetical protein